MADREVVGLDEDEMVRISRLDGGYEALSRIVGWAFDHGVVTVEPSGMGPSCVEALEVDGEVLVARSGEGR